MTNERREQEDLSLITGLFAKQTEFPAYGPDDSLFALGGDSLSALQIVSQIQRSHTVDITVSDVLECSTPRRLAQRMAEFENRTDPRPATRQDGRKSYPLAPSQESWYRMDRLADGAGFFNVVYHMRFFGDVDPGTVESAVGQVAMRQSALRMIFRDEDGAVVQRPSSELPPVHRIDIKNNGDEMIRKIIRREHIKGFDIRREVPARFTLARTSEYSWDLVCTIHHIVFDGASIEVLVRDITNAYRSQAENAMSSTELETGYGDLAEQQHRTFTKQRAEAAFDSMLNALGGSLPPPASVDSMQRSYTSDVEIYDISETVTGGLEYLARNNGATLFQVLLSGMTDAARHVTGIGRHVITIQASNRCLPGSLEVIGCFSNSVCVISGNQDEDSHDEAVQNAREETIRALRFEDVPLEHIVDMFTETGRVDRGMKSVSSLGFALHPRSHWRIALPGCEFTGGLPMRDGEQLDPTTFPFVLELTRSRGQGLVGQTQRLTEAWPDRHHERVKSAIAETFSGFSVTGYKNS